MKKNYFFILAFLCSGLISLAQPIITSADFGNYTMVARDVPNFAGITTGNAGANQTWNYGWLVPQGSSIRPDITATVVPVNTAPYYFAFPQANYCQKTSYIYNSLLFETYNFSKVSSTGIESLGTSNSDMISLQFLDTRFTPLPLHYGDTYVDTYQSTTASIPSSSNDTYDAYGTLTTPYGTFTDVFRLKQVGPNTTVYNWMKAGQYVQLLVIRVDNETGNVISVAVMENTTLAVDQNNIADKLIVYPNPVNNQLNLQLANHTINKIVITDMLGKTILEENHNIASVNVENLNSGLYIVKAFINGQIAQTKFVKQ